jgi:diadenosine tetraphosphate (Ap4A) HIT family hydrolase
VEIIDLAKADRAALFEEINAASAALRTATRCDKLNVAALGNQVRQLHVHVVARFAGDAAWPGPVWGAGAAVAYEAAARDRLVAAVRSALPALS